MYGGEREEAEEEGGGSADDNEEEPDALLALSSFSLFDHSMKELEEDELHSIVGLIIAEDLDLPTRQAGETMRGRLKKKKFLQNLASI